MRRCLMMALAVMILSASPLFSVNVPTAQASDWWCWDDPVLVIENQVVQIRAGVPDAMRHQVHLAEVVVTVPSNVEAKITASNQPRFPATSRLERGAAVAEGAPVTVQATLTVTSGAVIPIALLIRQPSGGEVMKQGRSDGSVSVSLVLSGKKQGSGRQR